jgi:hypothetical protein
VTDDYLDDRRARLELNARLYRGPDPVLEPIADAMDRGDTAAWTGLHPQLVDRASIYRDTRTQYRAAAAAGAIPADRGPNTAT